MMALFGDEISIKKKEEPGEKFAFILSLIIMFLLECLGFCRDTK
jgi:hypothetical protein